MDDESTRTMSHEDEQMNGEEDRQLSPHNIVDLRLLGRRIRALRILHGYDRVSDFTAILRGVDKEVDAYAFSIACLAIGPNEFDASTVGDKAEAFKAMPMMQALTVCAFFFGSSERYRNAMTGWSRSLVTSVMQQVAPMLRPHATA